MKNKILKTALSAIFISSISLNAFAAVKVVPVNGVYTINGTGEESGNGILAIKVSEAQSGRIAHASYTAVDENGDFTYCFSFADEWETGAYEITVTSDTDEIYRGTVMYADAETKADMIAALNAAKDPAAAGTALDDCIDNGIFAYPESFTVTDAMESSIYRRIAAEKSFTEKALGEMLSEIFALSAISNADEGSIDSVISEYEAVFAFENEKYFKLYDEFGNKSAINKMFIANTIEDGEDLEKVRAIFNEIVVLNEINNAFSSGTIVNIINNYSDAFPESITGFSDKTKLGLALLSAEDISTIKELEEIADEVEDDIAAGGSSGTGSGIGSGGGGGRGGSSSGGGGFASSSIELGNTNAAAINQKSIFADISEAEWARGAIEALIGKGVINGYETGDFRPNSDITREEFVKIIVNAFDIEVSEKDCSFGDMPSSHWAYSYVCTAKESGIVKGISDSCFGTGENITRQDMAVIISNAMKAAGKELQGGDVSVFTDSGSIADYAKTAVGGMKKSGIIGGYADGSFLPQSSATRAEAAQMIYNALKYMGMA